MGALIGTPQSVLKRAYLSKLVDRNCVALQVALNLAELKSVEE